jgi:glycosyltransferase involved in cell wall biosynthesis
VHPLAELGYRRERIEVIPNGIDPVEAPPARPGDGDFVVLCAARLQIEKRADRFVQAVAEARRTQPFVRGLLAGDGRERHAIAAMAAGSGVELLGERSDVGDLLAGADAFALTSDAEALPMSILEAMARAVPVVAPDLGGNSDLVVHGETGLLVPPGDVGATAAAIADLAADRERSRRLGAAGRELQRSRFDADSMADSYLRSLERVAGGG